MKTPLASTLLSALIISVGQAAIIGFNEDFSGPLDTGVWSQNGNANGHTGIEDSSYVMTAQHDAGGTKLQRFIDGTAVSFRNEIEVDLETFRLDANPGTQSDFKWKMFGPDGFMEIVLNSFGAMRLYHNDSDGGGGNIQPNTNIGISEGDLLNLTTNYNTETDTIEVTYALNGGAAQSFYSGSGIDGSIGDIITNFVEVELFKWGTVPDTPTIAIDGWNLSSTAIPEPSTSILLAGFLGLAAMRRRR